MIELLSLGPVLEKVSPNWAISFATPAFNLNTARPQHSPLTLWAKLNYIGADTFLRRLIGGTTRFKRLPHF
jgi:hypothetical protein